MGSKPGSTGQTYSSALGNVIEVPAPSTAVPAAEEGASSHVVEWLRYISDNPNREYSFNKPVPEVSRKSSPRVSTAANAAVANAHATADKIISAIHETHGANFSVKTLPKNLPPAEMARILEALAMEKRALVPFEDDPEIAEKKHKIHFPEDDDDTNKRSKSGDHKKKHHHHHGHGLRNLRRWRRLERAAARARREARDVRRLADGGRDARRLSNAERDAADAADAERTFKNARRLELDAQRAERAARSARVGNLRRLLSFSGRAGLYGFAAKRGIEALLVYATAPPGQSADKTRDEAWNTLTRSPLSREATAQFENGQIIAGTKTVASDIWEGTKDMLKFLGGTADALINHPDEVKKQLAEAGDDIRWLGDLYRKDPEQARIVSRQLLNAAGVVVPESGAQIVGAVHDQLTGDAAGAARNGRAVLKSAESAGLGDKALVGAGLDLVQDGLSAGLPPIPRPRALGKGDAPVPVAARPGFSDAAEAVGSRPAPSPTPDGT